MVLPSQETSQKASLRVFHYSNRRHERTDATVNQNIPATANLVNSSAFRSGDVDLKQALRGHPGKTTLNKSARLISIDIPAGQSSLASSSPGLYSLHPYFKTSPENDQEVTQTHPGEVFYAPGLWHK